MIDMAKVRTVRNDEGRWFAVEVRTEPVDSYDEIMGPVVRVHDLTYPNLGEFGQFTGGSAYLYNLLEDHESGSAGWVLAGGVPVWVLSAFNMNQLLPWLRTFMTTEQRAKVEAHNAEISRKFQESLARRERERASQ